MVIPPHDSRESIAGPRVFGARVAASLARAAVDAPRRSAALVFVLIVRRGLAPVGRGWRRAVVGRRRAEIAGVRRRWKCSRCGSRDVLSFAIGRGSGTGYARPLPSGSRFSLRAKRSTLALLVHPLPGVLLSVEAVDDTRRRPWRCRLDIEDAALVPGN